MMSFMRHAGHFEANGVHPMATVFPSLLLTITPLVDVVRLLTPGGVWARVAMWSALLSTVAVASALVAQLMDWLATSPHTDARREGAAPLMLHLAALCPLVLGVVERLHALGALGATAAPRAAFAWPFALAVAGAFAWLVADWMAEPRRDARLVVPAPRFRARAVSRTA
jgi:uncharacterized membrane protein